MPVTAPSGGRNPRASALLAAALLAAAAFSFAQTNLKMPDFRRGTPQVATFGPGEKCDSCGIIRAIREVQVRRPVPVPKQVQTNPTDRTGMGSEMYIGAVIALPMGAGGNPYVGGVGTPEMQERFSETTYDVVIRLDNGNETILQRRDGAAFNVGDRVMVRGTQLSLVAPQR